MRKILACILLATMLTGCKQYRCLESIQVQETTYPNAAFMSIPGMLPLALTPVTTMVTKCVKWEEIK